MKASLLWITPGAAALLAAIHLFPGRTALAPADFAAGGPDALEFCDPANPRFLPVVSRVSPVTMTLEPAKSAREGEPVRVALALRTASGKPVGPGDLTGLGGKLRLWLVDPALGDFHRTMPSPGAAPGLWTFEFTPHASGLYRAFADFTPAATEREMYVSSDLRVAASRHEPAKPAEASSEGAKAGDYDFTLTPSSSPIYARQPVTLTVSAGRPGGGMVPLVPADGAFLHLAAFDENRTGFARLAEDAPGAPPDPFHPRGSFRVTFADPGRYVLWSWCRIGTREVAVPFRLRVLP